MIVGDHRVGIASMVGGLRIAGTAELAHLDAEPNFPPRPAPARDRQARLPDLNIAEPAPLDGPPPVDPRQPAGDLPGAARAGGLFRVRARSSRPDHGRDHGPG
ncbi:MAG: hypothetical protein WDO24_27055 [Pseudomonadota bacterium]